MSRIQQIQFPLSLLRVLPERHLPKGDRDLKSFSGSGTPIAQDLIRWGVVHVGRSQWEKQVAAMMKLYDMLAEDAIVALSDFDRDEIAAFKDAEELPYYYQSEREAVQSAYKGFGFHWTSRDGQMRDDLPLERYEEFRVTYDRLRKKVPPKDAWVRVHKDIVFDLNHHRWPWDRFAVYCAILSKLGGKRKPFPIYYQEIQARADGYLSAKHFPDGYKPLLTVDQVRTRVGKLEKQGLIATYSPRHTRQRLYWLPHRVSGEEAELAIAERNAKKVEHANRTSQRERVEALTQSLLEARQKRGPS